jgi:hypothetical protein
VKLTRKAREQARHERATVYQELGDRAAAGPQLFHTCQVPQGRKYCPVCKLKEKR